MKTHDYHKHRVIGSLRSGAPGRASLLVQERKKEEDEEEECVQSADGEEDPNPGGRLGESERGKLLPVLENSERGIRNELGNGALGTSQLF